MHFVVVFNLTRLAQDPPSPVGYGAPGKYDHFAPRSHLQSLGISLRSGNEPIDDTSTGKLMEGVLADSRSSTTTVAQTGPGRHEGSTGAQRGAGRVTR